MGKAMTYNYVLSYYIMQDVRRFNCENHVLCFNLKDMGSNFGYFLVLTEFKALYDLASA